MYYDRDNTEKNTRVEDRLDCRLSAILDCACCLAIHCGPLARIVIAIANTNARTEDRLN